jgi:hypothetical protein
MHSDVIANVGDGLSLFIPSSKIIITNSRYRAHITVWLALQLEGTTGALDPPKSQDSSENDSGWDQFYSELTDKCAQHINEHLRVLRLWSPEFMPLATPLMTCILIGPAAVHAAKKSSGNPLYGHEVLDYLERQRLTNALQRFEEYWGIGAFMKGKEQFPGLAKHSMLN